ncbi:hypothetical protein GCM10022631_01730 [Deinococcus rubellus]|uniref:DUF3168 domain-containing protein n=1 Tax=Deinococcus rubellus TaxID=1889240 RepID=A0ABY5YI14_9DEIO|nr:hypothetical protein [Deinococcus rubellus]UWX64754.1 hypothetical protein N0D28_03585 [Deinococcus rubellus]
MSTHLEFRETLLATLADHGVSLGTYHVPELGDQPALWVGDPPEGTTIDSGLEVLIGNTKRPELVSTFGGNVKLEYWQLRIVNHGDGDLEGAMDAVDDAFSPETPKYIPEVGDIAEQVLFSILDDPEN